MNILIIISLSLRGKISDKRQILINCSNNVLIQVRYHNVTFSCQRLYAVFEKLRNMSFIYNGAKYFLLCVFGVFLTLYIDIINQLRYEIVTNTNTL